MTDFFDVRQLNGFGIIEDDFFFTNHISIQQKQQSAFTSEMETKKVHHYRESSSKWSTNYRIEGTCEDCGTSPRVVARRIIRCLKCSEKIPFKKCDLPHCLCNGQGRLYATIDPNKFIHLYQITGGPFFCTPIDMYRVKHSIHIMLTDYNRTVAQFEKEERIIKDKMIANVSKFAYVNGLQKANGPVFTARVHGACYECRKHVRSAGQSIMNCALCSRRLLSEACTHPLCNCEGMGWKYLTDSSHKYLHVSRRSNGTYATHVISDQIPYVTFSMPDVVPRDAPVQTTETVQDDDSEETETDDEIFLESERPTKRHTSNGPTHIGGTFKSL